jgi:hypothetical protein
LSKGNLNVPHIEGPVADELLTKLMQVRRWLILLTF